MAEFLLLADDLKLFKEIRYKNDNFLFQKDLNIFNSAVVIMVSLNMEKCNTISFSLNNTIHNNYQHRVKGATIAVAPGGPNSKSKNFFNKEARKKEVLPTKMAR